MALLVDVEVCGLPAPLAEALHFPEMEPGRGWIVALVVLAALLLAAWGWWWRRRRQPARPRPAPPVPVPVGEGSAGDDLPARVDAIRRRARETGDYRAGCHELAELLRETVAAWVGGRGREPIAAMTVGEMRRAWGEGAATRVFARLEDLQFGRRAPAPSQLDQVSGLVVEVGRAGAVVAGVGRRAGEEGGR